MSWTERVGRGIRSPGELTAEIGLSGYFRGIPPFFVLLEPHPSVLNACWEIYRACVEPGTLPAQTKALMGLVIADGIPSRAVAAMQLSALKKLKVPASRVTAVRRYLGGESESAADRACLEFAKESAEYTVPAIVRKADALAAAGLSPEQRVEALATSAGYTHLCRTANLVGA